MFISNVGKDLFVCLFSSLAFSSQMHAGCCFVMEYSRLTLFDFKLQILLRRRRISWISICPCTRCLATFLKPPAASSKKYSWATPTTAHDSLAVRQRRPVRQWVQCSDHASRYVINMHEPSLRHSRMCNSPAGLTKLSRKLPIQPVWDSGIVRAPPRLSCSALAGRIPVSSTYLPLKDAL